MYIAYAEMRHPATIPMIENINPSIAGAFSGLLPFLLSLEKRIPRAPVGMDKTPVQSRRSDNIPDTREAVSNERLPLSGL